MIIDPSFDFRSDTPPGKDPDCFSPTLRRYHQFLWSKPLPYGTKFELVDTHPGTYLYHSSDVGEFLLSSDGITTSLDGRAWKVVSQLPDGPLKEPWAWRIGGSIIFPSNRIDNRPTINGARGMHPRIADRFDLTLECIRRHYLGVSSPLTVTLQRYADFFSLFGDFAGYVDFFHLQDLVGDDGFVQFFTTFDNFLTPAVPDTVDSYVGYARRALQFEDARGRRLAAATSPGG